MPDDPAQRPPVEAVPSMADGVSAIASATAPFIYFDTAANFGLALGVANITLEAFRHTSVGDKVLRDRVMVAHLRMNAGGLQSLKAAIEGIELLAKPAPEGQAH